MSWPDDGVPSLTLRRARPAGKRLRRPKSKVRRVIQADQAAFVSRALRVAKGLGHTETRRGSSPVRSARPAAGTGTGGVAGATLGIYQVSLRGQYRVFNAPEYRLYRSSTGPPKESDTPYATTSTLPHEPADTFADGSWYLSLSYFNGVIDSGFLPVGPAGETYLRLEISGGVGVGAPPDGPLYWTAFSGIKSLRVTGVYVQTGALRAEEWAIGDSFALGDPAVDDPPADAPTATVTIPSVGLAFLDYEKLNPLGYAGFIPEVQPVRVRLQTRRNDGSWVYSEGSVVQAVDVEMGLYQPLAGESWPGRLPEDF